MEAQQELFVRVPRATLQKALDVFDSSEVAGPEQDQMTKLISDLRCLLASATTSEMMERIDWQNQYQEAVKTFRYLNSASCEPSLEQVRVAFTPEKLEAVATLRDPTLMLVTQDFQKQVQAINKAIKELGPLYSDTSVDVRCYKDMAGEVQEEGKQSVWPVFIEGMEKMYALPGDCEASALEERINKIPEIRHPFAQGTNRYHYAALLLHKLRQRRMMDTEKVTILDADEYLRHGSFFADRVEFAISSPSIDYSNDFQFRFVVQGVRCRI